MLGLVLLYFVGKAFYQLADKNERPNSWAYAILGIVSYYFGAFLGGILLAICYELLEIGNIDTIDDRMLGFLALPFGIIACWLTYKYLENLFTRKASISDSDLLDDDFIS